MNVSFFFKNVFKIVNLLTKDLKISSTFLGMHKTDIFVYMSWPENSNENRDLVTHVFSTLIKILHVLFLEGTDHDHNLGNILQNPGLLYVIY